MEKKELRYILASGSPRRKEILTSMGIDYEVIVADVEEKTDKTVPEEMVKELASLKAAAVAGGLGEGDWLVIGADTLVWHEGRALGKPADEKQAFEMIRSLSGESHSVYTGVMLTALLSGKRYTDVFYDRSIVKVKEMTDEEIREYIESGEPMDKAGAYAIQGIFSKYIEGFEGSYDNVVGLPSEMLAEHLNEFLVNAGIK
ncbi:MAG: Maf family protein [Lachnospiraceae bacterium]|nr:Maf family protein [Lachnospiraceae bacterium]